MQATSIKLGDPTYFEVLDFLQKESHFFPMGSF